MKKDKSVIDKLIQLSKIFKEGYTIAIDKGNIKQLNINTGYIVSYRTVITINIDNKTVSLQKCKIPSNTIIGGWFDKSNNTYLIELGTIYRYKTAAIKAAKKHKQTHIFNLGNGELIKIWTK